MRGYFCMYGFTHIRVIVKSNLLVSSISTISLIKRENTLPF